MPLLPKRVNEMGRVIQISILGRVSGNVNADEVIGTRVTLKKMYSSSGEVLPFVSARAVKYAIRQVLKDKGYEIDPFIESPEAAEALRLADSGRPDKYIDNDLFGYMVTVRGEPARRRQAPVALSYFKALKDTPIKAEFAARFPRSVEGGAAPVPFEVEVADFIGKLNCLIYPYIGDFVEDRKQKGALQDLPEMLDVKERRKRLRDFLEILLTPSYVLPRRTNSLNMPEYMASLVVFSEVGPLPIYQYLDCDFEQSQVDVNKLMMVSGMVKGKAREVFIIDYEKRIKDPLVGIKVVGVDKIMEVISEAGNFLIQEREPKK